MALGPEYTQVEWPLIGQLKRLGWAHLSGASAGGVTPADPRESGLLEEIRNDEAERAERDSGTMNRVEMALYGLLAEETAEGAIPDEQRGQRLADFTRQLHQMAVRQTTRMDFWRHPVDQDDFIKDITIALITDDIWHAGEAPVLVHELAHIRHRDHGAEFWRVVDRAMPGWESRRARLRQAGPGLWLP